MRPLRFLLSILALFPVFACNDRAPARARDSRADTIAHHLAPGEKFNDCLGQPWCPRLIVIAGGSFTMGVPPTEPGYYEIEGPQHSVIVRSFAAGMFDVTRDQWAAFVSATSRATTPGCSWDGRSTSKPDPVGAWNSLGFAQDGTHPVVCVTWKDAKDYVRWLSERTHQRYRLLSEAEWEYAARAGTTTAYSWGAAASHEFANYGAEECCSGRSAGRDKWTFTSPVGSFPPNAFGLYDMNGNVLQWVEDCLSSSYAGLPTDGSPNEKDAKLALSGDLAIMNGMNACSYRMLRGGDWGDFPALIRSGFRSFAPPPGDGVLDSYRSGGVGFRVARTLD